MLPRAYILAHSERIHVCNGDVYHPPIHIHLRPNGAYTYALGDVIHTPSPLHTHLRFGCALTYALGM